MTRVVDYSFARPGAAAIRAAGYVGAVRYLSPPPNEKNLDAAERDDLFAAGLAVGLVWETTETRPREGYAAGQSDATRANEQADELGAPSTAAIYYAVDRNDTTPDMVGEYFRGVLEVGHRPAGVYGSQAVCEAMLDLGCRYAWQVETWGDGVSERAHLVQLPNERALITGTDVNGVLAEDWGAWTAEVVGLDHLHPTFAARVANACRARGTSVYSGARSTEEQAELYRRYKAGTGNPANPPGLSWHEYGPHLVGGPDAMAVDFAEPYPHGEPGLIFPISAEPWHGQPAEIPETYRVAGADRRLPSLTPTPQPEEPDVAKSTLQFRVDDGETRRLPVLAIGGGFGWTKASVTFASAGVDVRRAVVGPAERSIPGLSPEGVESSRHFDGRGYIDLQAGDEWVAIELATSPVGTLDLYVEASDG